MGKKRISTLSISLLLGQKTSYCGKTPSVILHLKLDGTRAETRFRLSPKRTSPFKSAGASVQSTAGSRGVRISVSNAGYTTFRSSVRVLATHSIRQFPLHFPSRASPCAIRFHTHSNNEHLCTAGPLRIQSLYGKEMRQPSTSVSRPLLKEANHVHKKNQVTHTVNSEHLYTADIAINKRIKPYIGKGISAIYSYSLAGTRVQTKTNFTFPTST